MTLKHLTERETDTVFECLRCVASGEVIPNDWEFQTLFGLEFEEVRQIAAALPSIDESDSIVRLAINNTLLHILEARANHKWSSYISVSPSEVERVFSKWLAEA